MDAAGEGLTDEQRVEILDLFGSLADVDESWYCTDFNLDQVPFMNTGQLTDEVLPPDPNPRPATYTMFNLTENIKRGNDSYNQAQGAQIRPRGMKFTVNTEPLEGTGDHPDFLVCRLVLLQSNSAGIPLPKVFWTEKYPVGTGELQVLGTEIAPQAQREPTREKEFTQIDSFKYTIDYVNNTSFPISYFYKESNFKPITFTNSKVDNMGAANNITAGGLALLALSSAPYSNNGEDDNVPLLTGSIRIYYTNE